MAEWIHIVVLIILTVLNAFGYVLWWVFWKSIDRLEVKIDELNEVGTRNFTQHCSGCRLELEKQFLGKDDFKEFIKRRDQEWKEWWENFNNHRHDDKSGRTLR